MTGTAGRFQLLPELLPGEFAVLKTDIARRGVLVPIELDEAGQVLDGHHRLRAWTELRAEGVKLPPYPRIVRSFPDDAARTAHALRLNLVRRHLGRGERAGIEADLRGQGWSIRRIASELDIDPATVWRDLAGVVDATPAFVNGADGKCYPSRLAGSPSIAVASDRDERRARSALLELGDQAPARAMNLAQAERHARNARLSTAGGATGSTNSDSTWRIECCAFRDLELPPASVDFMLADPPYSEDAMPLHSELSAFAARVLRPGRLLACYAGKLHLPEVIERLGEQLVYVWCGVIVQPGRQSRIRAYRVRSGNRPVLLFSAGRYEPRGWIDDTLTSEAVPAKAAHPWEQALGPVAALVRSCSHPGELVCDPFLGSGTTAVAAVAESRRFIGCDIDPRSIATALARLGAAPPARGQRR
ncbi:MAG: DNA methyltransferase [Acidimicrobiales bacterium]|jgi:ParB-like chromosome segregation protein Spo0J